MAINSKFRNISIAENDLLKQIATLRKENTELSEQFHSVSKQISDLIENHKLKKDFQEKQRIWIPRREVMLYLKFADTQMSKIAKECCLEVAVVGKRKFYSTDGLLKALKENKL